MEKVAQLATALLEVTGIAPTTAQAEQIKNLYNALHAFDKKAIEVRLKLQAHLRGRFCSKKKSGHTTIQQMRRYVCYTSMHSVNIGYQKGHFSLGSQSLCHLKRVELLRQSVVCLA